jgi:hypothetical protein
VLHRNTRFKLALPLFALLTLFIVGVWPAAAQDTDVLPLPGAPAPSQSDSAAGESVVNPSFLNHGLLGDLSAAAGQFALPGKRGSSRLFTQAQQISPPPLADPQYFGFDLERDGDLMVVSAPFRNSSTGAAFIYQRNAGGAWVSPVTLTGSDITTNSNFGYSVAILGTTVFVSAPSVDTGKGAVYVFKRDAGGTWTQTQKLQPTLDDNDQFGVEIQIDPAGNQLIISALARSAAFIYYLDSGGQWQYEAELLAADRVESAVINGNLVLVGGYSNTTPGKVYVFEKNAGAWTQTSTFAPADGYNADAFGGRVTYANNQAFIVGNIGAGSGALYIFEEVGGLWTQRQKLLPSDGAVADQFGFSARVDGDTLVIGSIYDEAAQGSAYIFKWNGTAWVQDDKIPAVGGNFSYALDLTDGELLSSAPTADTGQGKVYSYIDPDLLPATELLVDGGFESDAAGWTIKNATSDKVKCNKTGKTFAYEGNCAWRFKGVAGENAKIQQTITSGVDSGDTLTLSGFVDATDDTDSNIKVIVKYLNPAIPKNKITVNIFETVTLDYVPLSTFQPVLTTDVVSAISKIKVSAKNQGESGKIYIDALSLTAK